MEVLKYYKSETQKKRDRVASLITLTFSGLIIYSSVQKEIKWIVLFFSIIFLIGVFQFVHSFINKPSLTIDEKGILSKANNAKYIEWKYIQGFMINNTNNRFVFLAVELNDDKRALKNKNSISKLLMKSNIKRLGSPVVFPSLLFQKPLAEVIEEIKTFKLELESEA